MHKSTTLTKAAIPNSAPFLFFILLWIKLRTKSIPPLNLISSTIPPTTTDIIQSSNMPDIPSDIALITPNKSSAPVVIPTTPANITPPPRSKNTFTPNMAPISTNKYGKTFINSTLYVSFNAATYPLVITVSNIIVMIAAGKTIAKFTLNLSLISQP